MWRVVILVALIFVLTLGGLATFSGQVLILALPLVLYLGAGLLFSPDTPQLEVERRAQEERRVEGDLATVSLRVTNRGGRLEEVWLRDELPAGLTVTAGANACLTTLEPGESVRLEYVVQGQRGLYPLRFLGVAASDALGLLGHHTWVEQAPALELIFTPTWPTIHTPIVIRPRHTRLFAGYIPARLGGSGVDFYGVRDYQPGDSPRHINWRAAARQQELLFTNEFEQERIADVGLIVDARRRSVGRAQSEALFDKSIQAAAALADAFLNAGNRVSLLVYGHFLDWTLPGYGKVQRERVLQALAKASLGDSQVFDRLEHLPTRLFPPKSQLVLISPLLPDDARHLSGLVARGYTLLVISPDAIRFEAARLPASETVALATRLAHIERALLLRRLRQTGVQVVSWNTEQPFDQLVGMRLSRPLPAPHLAGLTV